jgi:hypothetical protein
MPSQTSSGFARPLNGIAYWIDQRANVHAAHVEPLNRFVDTLANERVEDENPYIAPEHGGTEARVLSVFRDPSPATRRDHGTGLVVQPGPDGCETAGALHARWDRLREVTPWNAYPWYINPLTSPLRSSWYFGLTALVKLMPVEWRKVHWGKSWLRAFAPTTS